MAMCEEVGLIKAVWTRNGKKTKKQKQTTLNIALLPD